MSLPLPPSGRADPHALAAASDQLREDARRFRGTFDLAPVGLAHVSVGGEWLAVNRRLCALLGYTREELRGRRFQELTHPDDLAADLDQALRLVNGEIGEYRMVKRYLRKDGTPVWARLTGTLVRDEAGAPFHFLAAVEELSDVERAEAERRAAATAVAAERLALALDGADDGVWDWDVASGAAVVSPRLGRMLGYEPGEIAPHVAAWRALIHPDDRAGAVAAATAHLKGATPQYEAEYRVRHRDGRWVWVLDRGKVVARDGAGRALRAVGTHADVTARREAEAALAEGEARLRAVLDAAQMGWWEWDVAAGRLTWSDSHYALAGVAPGAFDPTAEGFMALVHPEDRAAAEAAMAEALAGARPRYAAEFRLVRPDGSVRWVDSRAAVRRDADGRPVRVVGTALDVTARKEAELACEASDARARRQLAELDAIYDAAPVGLGAIDRDLRYVRVNGRMAATNGLPAAEHVGRRVAEVLPDAAATLVPLLERVRDTGEPVARLHLRLAPPSDPGVPHDWLVDYHPIRDPGGQVIGVSAAVADITEVTRAQAALAASEAFARGVLDATPDCVATLDAGGRVRTVNAAGVRLLELDGPDTVLGREFAALFPAETDAGAVRAAVAAAAAGGRERVQAQRPTGRGEPRWWDVQVGPIAGSDGRPERVLAVARDVTALKAVEAAQATQDALLRTVVASIDDLVFAKDRDGRYLLANDATARVMGRTSGAEVVGRTDAELFGPDVAAELRANDAAVLRDGRTIRFEETARAVGAAGAAASVFQSTKAPLRGPDGRVAGVVGVSTDVTARVAAEDGLRASEAFARSVLEASPDCVKTLDLDGRLRTMNGPGLCLMEVDDFCRVEGADWAAAWAEGGQEAEARAAVATARAGGTARFAGFCPTARGAPRWWDVAVSPVRDARGAVTALLVVSRDVTAQREAAAERERLLRKAEAANQAKAQFLANMSHELRTPLNAIGGHVQLVELGIHGPVTEAQRSALGRVQRAQQHLLGLINDVLSYAKLEAGRAEYDLRETRAADVVRDVAPLVEPQLLEKGLQLTLSLPEDRGEPPVLVRADPEKLAQVLLNLLSNAVKFTPPVGADGTPGRVTVELAAGADDPGTAAVRVRDTGVGIPPEMLEAVFDPFVQVRTGYARTAQGTGLGLAISRDLARGMGGDLTAESTPGAGSTFTLTLPRA